MCPQAEGNPAKLFFAYSKAVEELEVLRWSAVVIQLCSRMGSRSRTLMSDDEATLVAER